MNRWSNIQVIKRSDIRIYTSADDGGGPYFLSDMLPHGLNGLRTNYISSFENMCVWSPLWIYPPVVYDFTTSDVIEKHIYQNGNLFTG